MINTSVRLHQEQIKSLQIEAAKIAKKTGMRCDWTALVRYAVDDLIAPKSRKKINGKVAAK